MLGLNEKSENDDSTENANNDWELDKELQDELEVRFCYPEVTNLIYIRMKHFLLSF